MDGLFDNLFSQEKTSKSELPKKASEHVPNPLDPKDLQRYLHWAKADPELARLIQKAYDNIRFIDQRETVQACEKLQPKIASFTKDEDFIVFENRGEASDEYIRNMVLKSGARKPKQILTMSEDEDLSHLRDYQGKYVYIDDASYSSSQLSVAIEKLKKRTGAKSKNIGIYLIGSTSNAKQHLRNNADTIFSVYDIPTSDTIYSSTELQKLESSFSWAGNYSKSVLTFFAHKVPDNFMGSFRRSLGTTDYEAHVSYYLVDDREKFSKPYGIGRRKK